MVHNGWLFSRKSLKNAKQLKDCGTGSWMTSCGKGTWYCSGKAIGSIKTVFKGSGKATLHFGNCNRKGTVKVFLNDDLKSTAETRMRNGRREGERNNVAIEFKKGDELKIMEYKSAILELYSFTVKCNAGSAGCSRDSGLTEG